MIEKSSKLRQGLSMKGGILLSKSGKSLLTTLLGVFFLFALLWNGEAGENKYSGVLNGEKIVLTLNIDGKGQVTGLIWESSTMSGPASAAIEGTNHEEGKIKIKVGYRFESLGTYVLTKTLTSEQIIWADEKKTFVFSRDRSK